MSYIAGEYDCAIVGAGHAGCEAALAAARMGCRTVIFTISIENVALMACNPSLGGPAKANIVREIDALGGEMGKNMDAACIQARLLNTGKGPAVYAIRGQADKTIYQTRMIRVLQSQENLSLKQAMVEKIILDENQEVSAVETETGAIYRTKTVILCTGTYLNGKIIIGDVNYQGGPNGQRASINLSGNMKGQGIEIGRFKTGTPARVDKKTLRLGKMVAQPGDEEELHFSFLTEGPNKYNVPCYLTYTNKTTHQVINDNIHLSPLFSGKIEGVGPRYCPSIEDKVVRFADKDKHQIFIEPEGLETDEMYVQGMSSSMPEEVQLKFLRTVEGMEDVEVVRIGYAIEYDYVIPTQLRLSLEMKNYEGLFCAGQINGSSGYEEAAAQGLMAGINAALKIANKEPFFLKRSEAYIGVLIDDLVTKGTNEPYRMMTSRAEYRLLLRQDNADLRLTEKGRRLGLVSDERYERYLKKKMALEEELARLKQVTITPSQEKLREMLGRKESPPLRRAITLYELLKRPELRYNDLVTIGEGKELSPEVKEQLEIQIKYEGYIEKQKAQVERFERLEGKRLPTDLVYSEIEGISVEARQKLEKLKPESIGQASRISGVSPADISVLLVYMEQKRQKRGK